MEHQQQTDGFWESNPAKTQTQPIPWAIQIQHGTCNVIFTFDIGLSINLDEAERRITDTKHRHTIKHKRRAPQYFEYHPSPLRITQESSPIDVGAYQTSPIVEMMIYDFGAVTVTYNIHLYGPMSGLLSLSDTLYDNSALLTDSRRRVEQLNQTIQPAVSKPFISGIVEDYAIYQLMSISPATTPSQMLADHGSFLAQILRAEVTPLSEQEVADALTCRTSFSNEDMVIIDWNAAIIVDTEAEDVRAVLEFANVELLEMRYLDDRLDSALEEAYQALTRGAWSQRLLPSSMTNDMRRIAELQVDSALLFEGVNNALKLLGDQYLARIYRAASQRLHLNDWDASIIRKLQSLESIYHKMTDHHAQRRMEILEWIIILLISAEIVMPFIPGLTG